MPTEQREIETFGVEPNMQNAALALKRELRGGQTVGQIGAKLDAVAMLDKTGETMDKTCPNTAGGSDVSAVGRVFVRIAQV